MIQVAICGDLNVIEGSCALINSILVNSKSDIRINIVTEYVDEYRQGINQWCDSIDVVNIINPNSIDLEEWQRSLQVNATGHLLVAREAIKITCRSMFSPRC